MSILPPPVEAKPEPLTGANGAPVDPKASGAPLSAGAPPSTIPVSDGSKIPGTQAPPTTGTPAPKSVQDLEARLEAVAKADLTTKEKQRQADILIKKYETAAPAVELLASGKTLDALKTYYGEKWNPEFIQGLLMDLAAHAAPDEETVEEKIAKALKAKEDEAAEKQRKAEEERAAEAKRQADEGWQLQLKNSADFLRTAVEAGKYPLIAKWDADPDIDHKLEYEKEWTKQLDAAEAEGKRGLAALPTFEAVWNAIEAKYEKRRAYYATEPSAGEREWRKFQEDLKAPPPLPAAPSLRPVEGLTGAEEARQRLRQGDHEARERERLAWRRQ
jgi:hypothetical protein